ncbi:MAG: prepilin-type N-terminal cleavage/methylation domain-containing protein [Firmicutes bacterium]|nr:prepilin-type N-terminal cleavage/methylation domain-containing protein [Bacillota bacterium]
MTALKNKGFSLIELIVGIAIISVISLSLLTTIIHINNLISKKSKEHYIKSETALIYKEIATLFSTRNIESITNDGSKYKIVFSKPTSYNSESIIKTMYEMCLDNNNFYIGDKEFKSNKYFKYTGLEIEKNISSTDSNYYYITFTLIYKFQGKEEMIRIHYLNDPVDSFVNIRENKYG